jgi:hypothetical protein
MSKFSFCVAIVVLAAALSHESHAAQKGGGGGGRGGGGGAHVGGGGGAHVGGGGGYRGGGGGYRGGGGGYRGASAHVSARPVISRSAAGPTSRGDAVRSTPGNSEIRSTATHNTDPNASRRAVRTNAVRDTLNSRSVRQALRNTRELRNSHTRANITATAATAPWHNGREHGWWRHRNGGYGWVGPLYWPFAYYDMYDYAMWGGGYDDSFWGYGYGDIYAGLFAPYDYDELTGYLPQYASTDPGSTTPASGPSPASAAPETPSGTTDQLAQMCGQDSRDMAGLPIDQFHQAIQLTDAQHSALDDLANASSKAAQDIKAACPTDIALTAPSRLAAMERRIEAMIAAVAVMQPPLEKFYDLLSDEQKARLTALANDQRESDAAAKPVGSTRPAGLPNLK